MKIIDLLNKINNNEEVPEKIKFDNTVFELEENRKEYSFQKENGFFETLLYRVMTTHFINVLLEAEVEVIEEEEIEEIDELRIAGITTEEMESKIKLKEVLNDTLYDIKEKTNELVRAVNKLNKERE